ncbi:CRISPR system Cascade subunit CasE [Peptoniphilus ivorii]|uniref:type I-E CRISPR-associated protein Cas6/Cse3/CasE n=1 Tax=Aedoeadaptatus ivorii TaxID=54006 RepID=UPI0027842C45|nr:type I-E CRISPR-associated protein Cas6/Cse3/CasE [Peptoniphilus ivorii]MDQ0508362.1 CRISPR system Cascade subunit CasE [Peptoniphilus ivorii]
MYISQVEIDRENREAMRRLNHVGAFHHWVESSFPVEMKSGQRSRKLWRIDPLNGCKYLLIVSPEKPDLRALEKFGVENTAQTKSYDKFLNSLMDGMQARFRVTLNPVIASRKDVETGERGRVLPHITEAAQRQFLMERAEKNGFSLHEEEFYIVERDFVLYRKSGQRQMRLNKVTYEGQLTIVDADRLRKTLIKGFGKKKAYGFGMMTVIPVLR